MVDAVTYILENDATIQGIIGLRSTGSDYKVFPVVVPSSETAPYIAVRLIGKSRPAKNCDFNYVINVVSYAKSYDDVQDLNSAIIYAIESATPATINSADFGFLNLTNEADDFVKENNLYAKILTFEGHGG